MVKLECEGMCCAWTGFDTFIFLSAPVVLSNPYRVLFVDGELLLSESHHTRIFICYAYVVYCGVVWVVVTDVNAAVGV